MFNTNKASDANKNDSTIKIIKTYGSLRKLAAFGLVMTVLLGGVPIGLIGTNPSNGAIEVYAATSDAQTLLAPATTSLTIRIGNNDPMTRIEFDEWRNRRGIRFFNFEGRIYPAGIFFIWGSANGQAFSYGELKDGILPVAYRPSEAGNSNTSSQTSPSVNEPAIQDTVNANNDSNASGTNNTNETAISDTQSSDEDIYPTPITFTDLMPILFSDEELAEMIERVSHQNPMDVRSTITLPNRRLTEYELATWIDEYNEMGGVTAFELAVVREINRVRVQHGLNPLALDPALMLSTRHKTQEFGDLQYQSHNSPVSGSPSTAARMFGFEGHGVAETITQSGSSSAPIFRATPEGIVRGMLASTRGHREILLNSNIRSVGFGAFFSPHSIGANGRMSHMFYFATKFGFYDRD